MEFRSRFPHSPKSIWALDLGLWVMDFVFSVLGFGLQGLDLRFWTSDFALWTLGFGFKIFDFRFLGLGFHF